MKRGVHVPNLNWVEDVTDSGLEPFRSVRDRDLAGRANLFMVEGEVALRVLVRHGRFPLSALLLSERRVKTLTSLLADLPDQTPVYVVPHHAIEDIVGFKMHRGVLGCGQRILGPSLDATLAHLSAHVQRVVLTEAVSNTDNMGAIFRNVAAFGGGAVLLDQQSCDPRYRKAIRVSSGQTLALPFCRGGTVLELVESVRRVGFQVAALTPCEAATPIKEWKNPPDRVALLVGAEGPGLSDAALASVDHRLAIPMATSVDSLNVATSVAVAMHQLQP